MKRLTKKADGVYITNCDNCPRQVNCYGATDCVDVLADRLAAYEDTGLEPEEIMGLCEMDRRAKMADMLRMEEEFGVSIDRLRELARAEKEGRYVVLPCKVGDTVFVITNCLNVTMIRDDDYFTGTGAIECPFESSCDIEECDDDHVRIFETTVTDFWHGENNCCITEMMLESIVISVPISAIGKTVFLTREAAEAALAGKEKE